jgi:tRNA G10  N-methylase Trm11
VVDRQGNYILGDDSLASASTRHQKLAKTLRSPIDEFEKRVSQNLQGLSSIYSTTMLNPRLSFSNAQGMPLKNSTVDLIVTSPPYASNAIDYMRAHKFALVWQNYSVAELSTKRKEYIGGESTDKQILEKMPDDVAQIINTLSQKDIKKGRVLHRYYSEMTRVLREMFRVLKPGGSAIVVVGSSVMRDIDTKTEECLASIGRAIGFDVPKIGVRNLDRDRRMLPAELEPNKESQIQQRMHQEYVIGFYKPVC